MLVSVELSSDSSYEKLSDDVEVLLEDELMLLSDEDEKDGCNFSHVIIIKCSKGLNVKMSLLLIKDIY